MMAAAGSGPGEAQALRLRVRHKDGGHRLLEGSCTDLRPATYPPYNAEGHERGPMTLIDATRHSVNTAFVNVVNLRDPPTALFHPMVLLPVLARRRAPQLTSPPTTRQADAART